MPDSFFSPAGYPKTGGAERFGEFPNGGGRFFGKVSAKSSAVHTFWEKLTTAGGCDILLSTKANECSQTRRGAYFRRKKGDPGASGDRGYGTVRLCARMVAEPENLCHSEGAQRPWESPRRGGAQADLDVQNLVLIHKNISSMGKVQVNFLDFFIENIWSLTQNLLHLCSCKAQIYKPKARMKYS